MSAFIDSDIDKTNDDNISNEIMDTQELGKENSNINYNNSAAGINAVNPDNDEEKSMITTNDRMPQEDINEIKLSQDSNSSLLKTADEKNIVKQSQNIHDLDDEIEELDNDINK